ncbi:MAG: hypothetical protein H7Y88_06235, partial [Phycisphaerales bacterium]|nr:hypothetical protein [Phycisphaerales bacterium]
AATQRAQAARVEGLFHFDPAAAPADAWTPLAERAERPARAVLLVHGLDEPGDIWIDFAPALAAANHTVIRFDYPNDQAIANSTDALGLALQTLRARGVTHVSIVGHSMGGLISRDVATSLDWYAADSSDPVRPARPNLPRLDHVIMVGTPHHGAGLIFLRPLSELREHLARWAASETRDPAHLLGCLFDGSGQAATDLLPGSNYLINLASRPLPTGDSAPQFTLITGSFTGLTSADLEEFAGSSLARELLSEKDRESLAAALAELNQRLGDGVVSSTSSALEAVSDSVEVDADHRSMLKRWNARKWIDDVLGRDPADAAQPPAIKVILDRLGPAEGASVPPVKP